MQVFKVGDKVIIPVSAYYNVQKNAKGIVVGLIEDYYQVEVFSTHSNTVRRISYDASELKLDSKLSNVLE